MKFNSSIFYAVVLAALLMPLTSYAADVANGKTKFGTLCASCHGMAGAGDGPVAQALPPEQKPANLAHGEMKFAKDEAKFKELLNKGGAAVGLNPLMPPQPGLTDQDISDLYAYVKSLKK